MALKKINCNFCKEKFQQLVWNQKCCTKSGCVLAKKAEHSRIYHEKAKQKKSLKLHKKENNYSRNRYKYNESIIQYADSPTGDAYIGLAKQPLMTSVSGIGFQGVKLQSMNRELIQCYECGGWFKRLTYMHVKKHGISLAEYKEKYGFNKHSAMTSDVYNNKLADVMINNIKKGIYKRGYNKAERMRKLQEGARRAVKEGKYTNDSVEKQNSRGTCPKQLKQALINHVHRFYRLPSSVKGRDCFPHIWVLKNRYGSLNNAFKHYGLPTRYKVGGWVVEYAFSDGTLMQIRNGDGYRELYAVMLKKCPVLNNPA